MSPYRAAPRRPNILFLFTDDQRHDTIHALGNREIATPTMDALVRAGTAFTHAHIMGGSCPAVCMPSRAMLMTGRTLFRLEGEGQGIPAEHVLLAEHLRAAGYATCGIGKWHNGPEAYARAFSAGAEIFFGGMDDHWNVPACDYDPSGRYAPLRPVVKDPMRSNAVTHRRCDHIRPGVHSPELFTDAAVAFLERHDPAAPFFLYVSFMAPHDPRTMPRDYLEMYDPEDLPLPPNLAPEHPFDNGELRVRDECLAARPRTPAEIRRHLAEYYAMITHADAQMARLLDVLRARGMAEDTIIVLAGDNGLALGQHGLMGKQNLYDHSLRVPLVLAGPGIPAGERREALCYLLDIFPTLCDLVGLATPGSVEGRSLLPALRDPQETVREVLLGGYRGVQRSARDARYKLREYSVAGARRTQLFDLAEDPWETRNLAEEPAAAEHVARLRREMVRWRDELGDTRPGLGGAFWRGASDL